MNMLGLAASDQPSTTTTAPAPAAKGLKRPRITVLGGGVIGLSAATLLAEAYPAGCVTVAAESFGEYTTSWGAGGLWKPFSLGATQDPHLINRWGADTFQHLSRLHASDQGPLAGCIATTGYALYSGGDNKPPDTDPFWCEVVPHFHRLSDKELSAFQQPYAGGYCFSTLICEGCRYLPWLTKRFQQMRVLDCWTPPYDADPAKCKLHDGMHASRRLVEVTVKDKAHLASLLFTDAGRHPHRLDCDILVNCSGLKGARDIFEDPDVYPIRGQVIRVVAPWVKQYYNLDGANYVIPNIDTVVLGGTSQRTGDNPEADAADRQAIMNNVCRLLPSLRNAEIKEEWVGYRPGRPSVRLELVKKVEFDIGDAGKKTLPVIHNYGHGGAGITLSWGCAMHTLELVQQALG